MSSLDTEPSAMQIDAKNRQVTLSVGEFAAFTPYAKPGFGGVAALWRAQLGTEWHQRLQSESQAAGEGFENEVSIAGALSWKNWTVALSGRIDQLKYPRRPEEKIHLREIKTLSQTLPLKDEQLLEFYRSYPIQLLTYRELMLREKPDLDPEAFQLDLWLVELGTGLTQTLPLSPRFDALLTEQLDCLVDYLESQQERLARLRALSIRPAYDTPRSGQETIQQDLDSALARSHSILLEAPTGYGKTGVAWEFAARQLANGRADRILYLTSKATGQTEAVTRLEALLQKSATDATNDAATYWHIRNKQEHCIHSEFRCSRASCPYLLDLNEKWNRSGLQRLYLLSHGKLDLDGIRAEGRSTGICPYEIMRAALGHRDIWIGDYNYLFSPNSARLLEEQVDFDPARTFLIIDEAHNLPSRVQSAFSFEFSLHPLYAAIDDLAAQSCSAPLRQSLKSLAALLTHSGNTMPVPAAAQGDLFSVRPSYRKPARTKQTSANERGGQLLDSGSDAELRHLLGRVAEQLQSESLPYDDLQADTLDLLFQLSSAHSAMQKGQLEHCLWTPTPGCIRLECIDAASMIASQINQYNGALLLSATLSPVDTFLQETGLTTPESSSLKPVAHLSPPAPWREAAYDVAIDLRVDTRFKSRRNHISTTAATIAAACREKSPVVVFFPSYAYAQDAYDELGRSWPELRIALQPRTGSSLSEQAAYLEESLAFNDALLLILGSSYAEGVDALGGKAGCAIVVSPALPEMNAIQEAKRNYLDGQGYDGFERAYLHPGIQKVNQALGRLVRAPEHKVKAILHCQRFGEPKTRRLLDPLYQSRTYIQNEDELENWLKE